LLWYINFSSCSSFPYGLHFTSTRTLSCSLFYCCFVIVYFHSYFQVFFFSFSLLHFDISVLFIFWTSIVLFD
jgi:hypothetical protein